MTVQQKVAWFNIAVLVASLLVYGILVPLIGPQQALAAFGVVGLWGSSPCSIVAGSGKSWWTSAIT